MPLEKPPDAWLDVTGPFPQRREIEPEDVQTVVKISAKTLPRDRLLEILVGGGDQMEESNAAYCAAMEMHCLIWLLDPTIS